MRSDSTSDNGEASEWLESPPQVPLTPPIYNYILSVEGGPRVVGGNGGKGMGGNDGRFRLFFYVFLTGTAGQICFWLLNLLDFELMSCQVYWMLVFSDFYVWPVSLEITSFQGLRPAELCLNIK